MLENKDSQTPPVKHGRNIIMIVSFVLIIEAMVLVSAFSQSGQKKFLQITDNTGQTIYEVNGEHLSEFDKYYFENTFGSLDKYVKRIENRDIPFPFRAWLTAAAGLPLFLMLLSAFAVKAYDSLFVQKEQKDSFINETDHNEKIWILSYLTKFERLNIFAIGFILLTLLFLYWVVPNLLNYLSKTTIDFIITYKWFFICLSAFAGGTMLWIIYLRYLLARRTIEAQKEIAIKQIEYSSVQRHDLIESSDLKRLPDKNPRNDSAAPFINE